MRIPLLLVLFVYAVYGHMAVYINSMWGREPSEVNSNWAVEPLQDYNFSQWWMHGPKSINDPPPAAAITQIPAGGTYDFEIVANKAFSSIGWTGKLWCAANSTVRRIPNPWSNDMGNAQNIHAPLREHVAGCAIGIAYKSDINAVRPEDFVIVSVARDCIARQLQAFDFPALPACPNGKCICSWFWIHNSAGGTDQMYMTPFQCNIKNPTNFIIGKPSTPVRCDGEPACWRQPTWGSKTTVCPKVLNPMYWKNLEGNNIYNPGGCSPHYNASYGYPDGAQNQIFTNMPAPLSGSIGDTMKEGNAVVLSSSPAAFMVSPCRRTKLVLEGNGNIVMYNLTNSKVHWTSNTGNQPGRTAPYKLYMQADGNLVLRDSTGFPMWSSASNGKGVGPFMLKLRDQRSLAVVDRDGTPIWTAATWD